MKKILVAEDEKEVRESIIDLLESVGYEVVSAENGLEAINYLNTEIPDLVISDITMPYVNGFQVLEHVQNLSSPTLIPFIFLTARVDDTDIRRGMNSGASDYLKKPFRAKELLQIIETQLRKKEKSDKILDTVYMDIAAYVPHEMRTPLVPIIGYAELIREEFRNMSKEEVLDLINIIISSGHRLHRTIEKFIKYTDIRLRIRGANPYPESPENVVNSAGELIRKICDKISSVQSRERDFEISLVESKLNIFPGDYEFIVEEIITNAVKFSNPGTKISVEGIIKEKMYVLTVTDHGRGIPKDQLNNINPFRQHQRKIYQQAGNGLGLVSVKKLTEFYAGYLKIKSVVNEYTTCTAAIPVN